ncbi:hypothetical protein T439DRAFT_353894 [Meredithblackwellia eburnea MCA 4105]
MSEMTKYLGNLNNQEGPFYFVTEKEQAWALQALTHSSLSPRSNNVELARVGEKVALAMAYKRLMMSPGIHTGADYDRINKCFTILSLSEMAQELGVHKILRIGSGLTTVSDAMLAQSMNALFFAVEIPKGPEALQRTLGLLKIT